MNPKELEKEGRVPIIVGITIFLLALLVLMGAYEYNSTYHDIRRSLYESINSILHLNIPVGVKDSGVIFALSIIGALLEIYILLVLVELIYYGRLRKNIREVRLMSKIRKMKDHYIICGGGRVGESIAEELQREGKNYVVIEKNPERVEELKLREINVVEGNSLEEEYLKLVGIERAAVIIACLGHDGDNLLQVIIARDLNPNIKIVARANDTEFIKKLQSAGAHEVINPAIISGKLMARAAERLVGE